MREAVSSCTRPVIVAGLRRRARRLVMCSLLFVASAAGAAPAPIQVRVTPRVSMSGVTARVDVRIDPGEDDRALEIVVESEDYFRLSERKLQGPDSTRVQVAQAVVTLSGTVADARSRREANRNRPQHGRRAAGRGSPLRGRERAGWSQRSDNADPASVTGGHRDRESWITTLVQPSFFADPDIKGHDIDVRTNAGVVALTGQVGSTEAKDEAGAIAKEIDGVKRVMNRLTIGSPT